MNTDWREFSEDSQPATGRLVWAYDPDVYGVTPAILDFYLPGCKFFRTCDGNTLVDVTHWAEIEYPDVPEGVDD